MTGFRPIDLARLAGVSTQQIRNYATEGILPPVPRTASGYRTFGAVHRWALLTYQALSRGYGRDTARAVMQAVHAGELPLALTLVDAGHVALHDERLSLQAAGAALEAVAEQSPDEAPLPRSGMRIGEVGAYLGVRTSTLRLWESAGLLAPKREPGTRYRSFGPADVRDARMINMLRQGRYPFPQIRLVLDGLRRTGSSDALRAAIAQRQAQLTRRARAMLDGSSHLHHYLEGEAPSP
ncbi:MerR family transcriptional regulator [Nonomuraea sp. LPB2021202275-12-8]|uniref:MerR family transcriptional regulator n=1 Tax=Nonomuraea sp. LPB2021202275-12-8 TaxID=3120159 RepID=UPI00300C81B3